jgi:CheY-like chemotaxis protein
MICSGPAWGSWSSPTLQTVFAQPPERSRLRGIKVVKKGVLANMLPASKFDAIQACILIVEDEPLVRAVNAESLRDAGFSVVEAANGNEALAYIEAGAPVDLVFSDIRISGPMDGIALARRLKTTNSSLPVILTSANPGSGNITDLGPFIQKPYRPAQVMAQVVQILGLRPPNESNE